MAVAMRPWHIAALAGTAIAIPAGVWLLRTYDPNAAGNPLPPLDGTLSTPQLEIAGAQLQGVEVEFEGDGVDASTAASPPPSP